MALVDNISILNTNNTNKLEPRLDFSKYEKLLDSFEKYSQKLEKLLEETSSELISNKDFR